MKHHYQPEIAEALLRNRLKWEDKLEFLLHLDECSLCWDRLYELRKTMDAQLFRPRKPKRSRKRSRAA
ncbi:MAG TPA: hypothetical protein VKZ59_11625 [Acidobacteriota bacterium]|nr:hypothetical protein [Acidobacteriota bacterium]